jgi:hypothetical protein
MRPILITFLLLFALSAAPACAVKNREGARANVSAPRLHLKASANSFRSESGLWLRRLVYSHSHSQVLRENRTVTI